MLGSNKLLRETLCRPPSTGEIGERPPGGALIELGSATRPLASLNPNLIGRPVSLRPLARTLLEPVRPREAVLHFAVAMANPNVEVRAVGHHGVAFRQYHAIALIAKRQRHSAAIPSAMMTPAKRDSSPSAA